MPSTAPVNAGRTSPCSARNTPNFSDEDPLFKTNSASSVIADVAPDSARVATASATRAASRPSVRASTFAPLPVSDFRQIFAVLRNVFLVPLHHLAVLLLGLLHQMCEARNAQHY